MPKTALILPDKFRGVPSGSVSVPQLDSRKKFRNYPVLHILQTDRNQRSLSKGASSYRFPLFPVTIRHIIFLVPVLMNRNLNFLE